jgi:hypothetical protein
MFSQLYSTYIDYNDSLGKEECNTFCLVLIAYCQSQATIVAPPSSSLEAEVACNSPTLERGSESAYHITICTE